MKLNFRLLFSGASSLAIALLSGAATHAAPAGIGPSFKGPVGLQLYSLREQFAKNVPATMDEVKSFGIRYVELAGTYDMPPEKFKAELAQRGIEAVSGHFKFENYRDNVESVVKEAQALGLKYAGC